NRTSIRSDLTTYANNLISYINQNNRAWNVANIIGGKTIQPLTGSPLRIQHAGWVPTAAFPAICPNQLPANIECRTFLSITMPGATSTATIKLSPDQVYAHRITLTSTPSGENFFPTLLIDGAAPSCATAGPCHNTGSTVSGGTLWSMSTQITGPNLTTFATCTPVATDCRNLSYAAGSTYLLALGAGRVSRSTAEYHRKLLDQARAVGNPDTSEV